MEGILKFFDTQRPCELCSWNDLMEGDVFYHIHLKEFNIKTGKHTYFTFDDRTYHHWPKLIQDKGYDNKNFVRCKYSISADIDEAYRVKYVDEKTKYLHFL